MAHDFLTPGAHRHAVITGPITGRVETPDPLVPADSVQVTPDVLYLDTQEQAVALADAIEDTLWQRGTHPLHEQLAELEAQADVTPQQVADHKRLIDAKDKTVRARTAKHGRGRP